MGIWRSGTETDYTLRFNADYRADDRLTLTASGSFADAIYDIETGSVRTCLEAERLQLRLGLRYDLPADSGGQVSIEPYLSADSIRPGGTATILDHETGISFRLSF